MSAEDASANAVIADLALSAGVCQIHARITVTKQAIRIRQMLPLVQSLADQVVDGAVEAVRQQGQQISCKKGCAACCRQLVPIAPVEARALRELVEGFSEPRRSVIGARFAEARRRLEQAGMLQPLLESHAEMPSNEAVQELGIKYFKQAVACPFLEEESCSIYENRPVACREYLVTSPAEHCADPSPQTIRHVPMPFRVWPAIARLEGRDSARAPWVALPLALEWAENHPDEAAPRPGPELVRELVQNLTGKAIPPPPASNS